MVEIGSVRSNFSPPLNYLVDTIGFLEIPACKNKFLLHQKYVVEGRSIKQISREVFSSKDTIRKHLIQFGIPIRKSGQHHGNPANPKYGTQKRGEKLLPHLQENKIIQAVNEMHAKGVSFTQIVKFLTQIGVPTKKRSGKWSHEMVRMIVYREIKNDGSKNALT